MLTQLGKYTIRSVLGKGAMGVVYEAWDEEITRRFAIKTVALPDSEDSEEWERLSRFKREAKAAGRLIHPNIVGVVGYGETAEVAYIVMEFVEGPTLKGILEQGPPPGLAEIGRMMGDLLAGLGFSHSQGVIHRDIKPANIMVGADGALKITDFGIARIDNSTMTQVGDMMGTPAYMSPEQFQGAGIDARSDLYSAGVLLFQLLTGRRPFEGSLATIIHAVVHGRAPAPSSIVAHVPPALDQVVARAIARDPDDRFQTAAAFNQALQAAIRTALAGDGVAQPAEMPVERRADAFGGGLGDGLGDLLGDGPVGDATQVSRGGTAARMARTGPGDTRGASPAPAPVPTGGGRSKLPLLAGAGAVVLVVAGVLGWALTRGGGPPAETARTAPTAVASVPAAPPAAPAAPALPAVPSGVGTAGAPAPSPPPAPAVTQAPRPAAPPAPPPPMQAQAVPSEMTPARPPAVAPAPDLVPTPAAPPSRSVAIEPPAPAEPPAPPPVVAKPVVAPTVVAPPVSAPPVLAPPVLAPPVLAPPVSAPPVPTPAPSVAAIAAALAGVPCTAATGELRADGVVAVRGVAGRGGPERAMRDAVQRAAPGSALEWRVTGAEGPYCGLLDVLRPMMPPFGARVSHVSVGMADGRTDLVEKQPMLFQATLPDHGAALQLDYVSSDGTILHVHQAAGALYGPLAAPVFGRAEGKFAGWEVGCPFGTDLVIGVASSVPLFRAARPAGETLQSYLPELTAALERVRRGGARLSADAVVLNIGRKDGGAGSAGGAAGSAAGAPCSP